MEVLISYLKDNYLDLIAKAILSILSIILLILRSKASKKLKSSEQLSAFLSWIPYAVRLANELYPTHGDGAKRLNYVVEKCSSLFPMVSLNTIVESVDQILQADKKGGDSNEKDQGSEKEGSQDLRQDCTVYKLNERASEAVPWRYSSLKK